MNGQAKGEPGRIFLEADAYRPIVGGQGVMVAILHPFQTTMCFSLAPGAGLHDFKEERRERKKILRACASGKDADWIVWIASLSNWTESSSTPPGQILHLFPALLVSPWQCEAQVL